MFSPPKRKIFESKYYNLTVLPVQNYVDSEDSIWRDFNLHDLDLEGTCISEI